MKAATPREKITEYFRKPQSASQKQYEALRSVFIDRMPANDVARQHGYTLSTVYSLTRDFKQAIAENRVEGLFFVENKPGRKQMDATWPATTTFRH